MSSIKRKCQVVMLPTEKATNIISINNKLELINKAQMANTINSIVKGFYLYILSSDEEIKEGDWHGLAT